MAANITLLRSVEADQYGNINRTVMFWYVISPKVQDVAGNFIAPQTAAQATAEASRYLTAADLAALDSGDAGIEITVRTHGLGESNAQFRTRMQNEHAARQAAWIAARRGEYQLSGTTG